MFVRLPCAEEINLSTGCVCRRRVYIQAAEGTQVLAGDVEEDGADATAGTATNAGLSVARAGVEQVGLVAGGSGAYRAGRLALDP